jgi:hypothetical protein
LGLALAPDDRPPGSGDHPAELVRQVLGGLMTTLTAHGHTWTPQQTDMVARALGILQRWEDGDDKAS